MNSNNTKFITLSPKKKKLIASKAINGDTYVDSLPLYNTPEIYVEKNTVSTPSFVYHAQLSHGTDVIRVG
jgi:hypothetical protein